MLDYKDNDNDNYQCNTGKIALHQLEHKYITIHNPSKFKTKNRNNGDYSSGFNMFSRRYKHDINNKINEIRSQLKNLIHLSKSPNSKYLINPHCQNQNSNSNSNSKKINIENNFSGYSKKEYYKNLGLSNEE